MVLLVFGNIVGIAFQVHYKHHNSLQKYLADYFAKMDAVVNIGLFGLLVAGAVHVVQHPGHSKDVEMLAESGQDRAGETIAGHDWIWVTASAFAGECYTDCRQQSANIL